ncbi:hypothetical protein SNE26_17510 [Mucilaginibacter sp. cycad4]|uniref:hypothetical protein n=1 Tax=Mucilaginibacter sp. cycad4 TaxID=3342096 RepID=UPI002AAB5B6D|nr:hypothetical protein [Mucilaginibacter gossypii]WPU97827.1 hypothetical protein SNE26_17510 [Mucilaginibacter gossypii]
MELIRRLAKPSLLGRVWVGLLFAFSFQPVQAQTFAEWFNQKKTLIKYLTQQIIALEQYGSYVKQGYQISQHGLGNIGGWVKGEYGLHSSYYNSLKTINPEIRNKPKADSIANYALQISPQYDRLNGLNGLDQSTLQYIGEVRDKVISECNKDLAELELVMTGDKAQMTDDERLTRLDNIYSRMKDKYAFTQSFCNQVRVLLAQHNNELNQMNSLKQVYGIN